MKIIDLSAPLNESIHCYPTDPPFNRTWHLSFSDCGANVSKLEMGAHTGTHVDAPLHFIDGGKPITALPLDLFLGEALVIGCHKESGELITPSDLDGKSIGKDDIVLFRTGWEKRANTNSFFVGEWPAFHPESIKQLIELGVKAIGGDIPSADNPSALQAGATSHRLALEANLPIFEGLINLEQLVGRRFFFIALPLRLDGAEASPVRAIAVLNWSHP